MHTGEKERKGDDDTGGMPKTGPMGGYASYTITQIQVLYLVILMALSVE